MSRLNLGNAYKIYDNIQTVTFTSINPTSNTTDSVPFAIGQVITRDEVLSSGGYLTFQDRVWHLPVAELTTTPKEGDRITDASSVVWVILEVRHASIRTRWRCVTRRER